MQDRPRVLTGSALESVIGYCRAVKVGSRILVSGTGPAWPDGGCDPDATVQARRSFEIILAALAELGAGPEHVVRTRLFLTDAGDGMAVAKVHGDIFGAVRPASTSVVVAALLDPRWKVEIEAEAELGA